MTTILLILLVALDLVLLGIVYFLGKKKINPIEILNELTEERRLLNELRLTVKEELEIGQVKCREMLDKVTTIATEAELEVKSSGETLTKAMEQVLEELSERIDEPLRQFSKRQHSMETLVRKADKERQLLQKAILRGEKICSFFDKSVPYEEVLQEIQDKKYSDARHLLSQGIPPLDVARELGISESEVKLLVAVS